MANERFHLSDIERQTREADRAAFDAACEYLSTSGGSLFGARVESSLPPGPRVVAPAGDGLAESEETIRRAVEAGRRRVSTQETVECQ